MLLDMPIAIAALESGKHLRVWLSCVPHTERAYLASCKKEPEADITECKYIKRLMVYDKAMYICSFRDLCLDLFSRWHYRQQFEKISAVTTDAVWAHSVKCTDLVREKMKLTIPDVVHSPDVRRLY